MKTFAMPPSHTLGNFVSTLEKYCTIMLFNYICKTFRKPNNDALIIITYSVRLKYFVISIKARNVSF